MPLPPKKAPFSFEPVSPPQSEIYSELSGSEDDLDEAARASKRRRIERHAQDYLKGQPPFIFSASLKGPFNKKWTNPWKRVKPHSAKSAPDARIVDQGHAGPGISVTETRNKGEEPEFQPAKTASSIWGESSAIKSSGSSDRLTKSGGKAQGVLRRKTDKFRVDGRTTIPPSSISRSSTKGPNESPSRPCKSYSASSREGWLKRGPTDHRTIEPLKSPSPTPVGRQKDVKDTSKPAPLLIDNSRIVSDKAIQRTSSPSGFTPINQRQHRHTEAFTRATTFSPSSDRTTKNSGTGYLPKVQSSGRRKSSIPKKRIVSGNKHTHDDIKPVHPTKKPGSETVTALNKAPTAVSPSNGHNFKFKYRRPDSSIDASTKAEQPQKANFRRSGVSFYDFADSTEKPVSGSTEHAHAGARAAEPKDSNKEHKQGSGSGSNENSALAPDNSGTLEADSETAGTIESCNITSAQLPPEYAKLPTEVVSLQSTCFAELKSNTIDANSIEENHDLEISTQAAVSTAQKSLQDALTTPDKEARGDETTVIKRPLKSAGSSKKPAKAGHKITPFGAVDSTAQKSNGVVDHSNSVNARPVNTQALLDAISPFAVSTTKKVQNRVSFPSDNEINSPTRPKQNPTTAPPIPSNQTGSLPVLDEGLPVSPFEISGFDFGTGSDDQPADPIESAGAPSASALQLTSTTSTGPKQDGQQVRDLDNFDLSQAIADAGTFLQSWDIDRDLRTFSGNVHSSASVPERQPVLSLDG